MSVPGSHPQRKTAAVLQREQRKQRVLSALLSGLPLRDVAEQVGVSLDTVRHDAAKIQAEWKQERLTQADELVDRECKRLDALLAAHWESALGGDEAASKIVLRITDQRARLLGLNAEHRVKLDVSGSIQIEESPEFLALTQAVMTALAPFPEQRRLVAQQLAALGSGEVIEGECREVPDGEE